LNYLSKQRLEVKCKQCR